MFIFSRNRQFFGSFLVLATFGFAGTVFGAELSDAAKVEFFDSKVLPVLKENCFKCHGAREKLKGNLRLTNRDRLVEGRRVRRSDPPA